MSSTISLRRIAVAALVVTAGLIPVQGTFAASTPGSLVRTPSAGPTQVIGGTSNGCVAGASTLPETGTGFVSVRRYRNRFYGHPELMRLIGDIGRAADRQGLGLIMIGDLSQPRGGRMPSSHRSHQNGLDVDIWFTQAPSAAAARRLMNNKGDPQSMVRPGGLSVSSAWGPAQRFLLETTARDRAVDRIFVNPAIKRALCREVDGDRGWLRKVRPWYGHDAHFHVRLRCPADNPQCKQQAPIPTGDGCGASLSWWFSAEARNPPKKKGKPKRAASPPAACTALFRQR